MAAVGAVGCGDATRDDEDERSVLRSVESEPGALDGGIVVADGGDSGGDAATPVDGDAGAPVAPDAGDPRTIRDPNGAYYADVTANGTGCPAGTWGTSLSADGQSFSVSFASFEAEVDKTQAIAIKDCTLSIKMHSPQTVSYTVQDVSFGGYVYAEPGVSVRAQGNYYFMGYPAEGAENILDLTGPIDQQYVAQGTTSPVRSRCGTDHTLNLRMTLRLKNSEPPGNGYVDVIGTPKYKLSWRRCSSKG